MPDLTSDPSSVNLSIRNVWMASAAVDVGSAVLEAGVGDNELLSGVGTGVTGAGDVEEVTGACEGGIGADVRGIGAVVCSAGAVEVDTGTCDEGVAEGIDEGVAEGNDEGVAGVGDADVDTGACDGRRVGAEVSGAGDVEVATGAFDDPDGAAVSTGDVVVDATGAIEEAVGADGSGSSKWKELEGEAGMISCEFESQEALPAGCKVVELVTLRGGGGLKCRKIAPSSSPAESDNVDFF